MKSWELDVILDLFSHLSDWQKVQKFDNILCWQGQGEAGNLLCRWWEYKAEPLSQRGIWQYLTKLHTHLLLDLAIPLLSIYSENKITNMKQQVHKIIQSIVYNSKNCKQRESPLGHWLNNMVY